MKKLFLILPVLLFGCVEMSKISAPSETIENDKCVESQTYKVFQVFDSGALASECKYEYGVEACYGLTVFVPTQKGEELYDDKIIKPSDGKCIIYNGVYKYTSKGAGDKTVPKLKIIDSKIPNPAYIEWQKNQKVVK